ncbi:MAG: ABC transporter permease [bacterium]|nr:ABC transporter permease [bacterium]
MIAAFELCRHRQLLLSLTWRDLQVRYKQTWLGMGWAVLLPVAMTLIFSFVFTRAVNVVGGMNLSMPYPLFAYLGLVPWVFFSASLTGCVTSLVSNRNLVTKVNFPREVFPLSAIGSAAADFLVAGSVLIGLGAYFHYTTDWEFGLHGSILFLPVVVAVQITFTAGLGLLLAMGNLFYRDVRQVSGVGIQLWMFLTCVLYPMPQDGSWFSYCAWLNPMTPIISAYRACVIEGRIPFDGHFLYSTLVALVTLVLGWWCFGRWSHRFAECI